jgi:hypothetical protein
MSIRQAILLVAINVALSIVLLAAYALRFAPAQAPRFAVLDVGELYRLKENQVAAVLVKHDASDEERATALKRAAAFGAEVTALIQALPEECRCLVLARGAVIGPAQRLPDLTPDVRRRLGL